LSKDQDAIPFSFEPLTRKHDREAFSCGSEPLDRYLKTQARQDASRGFAAPIVAVTGGKTIIAYYTLASYSVGVRELPEDETKGLPKYPDVPATLLGRLAVDQEFRGQGFGGHMLLHALKRSYDLSAEIASFLVVVDAKDDTAIAFYEHYGFKRLPDRPDRLYLPMKQIAKLDL